MKIKHIIPFLVIFLLSLSSCSIVEYVFVLNTSGSTQHIVVEMKGNYADSLCCLDRIIEVNSHTKAQLSQKPIYKDLKNGTIEVLVPDSTTMYLGARGKGISTICEVRKIKEGKLVNMDGLRNKDLISPYYTYYHLK